MFLFLMALIPILHMKLTCAQQQHLCPAFFLMPSQLPSPRRLLLSCAVGKGGAGRRRVWEGSIRALCRRFCSSLPARSASLSPASTPFRTVCGCQQPPLQYLPEKLCSKFVCLSHSLKVLALLLALDYASLLLKK